MALAESETVQLARFLTACEQSLGRSISPRDRILLTRLAMQTEWGGFVRGAAGLLADNATERTRLVALGAPVVVAPERPVVQGVADDAASQRRSAWMVLLTVLAVSIGAGIWVTGQPSVDTPIDAPSASTVPTTPISVATGPGFRPLELVSPASTITHRTEGPKPPTPPIVYLGFALLGLGLAGAGMALLARPLRRRRAESQAAQARKARRTIDLTIPQLPIISAFEVVGERASLESATLLGGLMDQRASDVLDIDATIAASIEAGGRIVPIHEPRLTQARLTVLLDEERHGHVWLQGFYRLLDEWRRHGVLFDLYRYSDQSMRLEDERGRRISIEALAEKVRHQPGEGPRALLILARRLSNTGDNHQRGDWPDHLDAWTRRAWLVPQPRIDALSRSIVKQAKLRRFPLTDDGVLKLSAWFAGADTPSTRYPPLPKKNEGALWRWLLAAVMVPDASWDQLERIRRLFIPHYSQRWHVDALLAFVQEQIGGLDHGAGPRLDVDRVQVNAWLVEHGEADPDFERQVRTLLIDEQRQRLAQLKQDSLEWQLTRLSILRHQLNLELDAKVLAQVEALATEASGADARQLLEDLKARGLGKASAQAWTPAGARTLQTLLGERRAVPARWVASPLLWAGVAACIVLGGAGVSRVDAGTRADGDRIGACGPSGAD